MIWRSCAALLAFQAPEIHLETGKSSHLAIRRGQDEVSFQSAKSTFWEGNIDTCQVKERSLTPSAALLVVLTWQDHCTVHAGKNFTCALTYVWDRDGTVWCLAGLRFRLGGIAARELERNCSRE